MSKAEISEEDLRMFHFVVGLIAGCVLGFVLAM